MENKTNTNEEDGLNVVRDDGAEQDLLWQAAEEKNIRRHLARTHEERFSVMMRLMRMGKMLSNAKITHQKI